MLMEFREEDFDLFECGQNVTYYTLSLRLANCHGTSKRTKVEIHLVLSNTFLLGEIITLQVAILLLPQECGNS